MTGRCIAVNLGPPSPITLMPPMQLLNLLPPPPVLPPAAAVPHRPLTPKVSAQSTSLSTSSHFYTTPRHTPSPSSPPSTALATTVSSLLTRVQQTTCSRTRVHSFRTGLSPVAASAWATTPLPPSWARDRQSSQSMDGSSWFGTASTFRPSAIHSTASVLINVRMVVVLSGCVLRLWLMRISEKILAAGQTKILIQHFMRDPSHIFISNNLTNRELAP